MSSWDAAQPYSEVQEDQGAAALLVEPGMWTASLATTV